MTDPNAVKLLRGNPPGEAAPGRAKRLVRLAGAAAVCLFAAGFAHFYSLIEANWLEYGMKARPIALPLPTHLFHRYGAVAFLLPLVVLVLGAVAERRGREGGLFLEAVIQVTWVLAVLLVLSCLLAWRLPYYIPVEFIK